MKHRYKVVILSTCVFAAACGRGESPPAVDASMPASSPVEDGTVMATEHQSVSFDLPTSEIVSIRIDPTASVPGKVTFSRVELVTGDTITPIEICGDRRLQLVRSKIDAKSSDACRVEFGNESQTGWFVPYQLRNLPAESLPRRLEIDASGDLTGSFRVYFDVGNGYSSRDMVLVQNPEGKG